MKRFAWLWGALVGAVLLPFLMVMSREIMCRLLPTPSGVIFPAFNLSDFLRTSLYQISAYGLWGAELGFCGSLLWAGNRSLLWRLLSLLAGTGTAFYHSWRLWTNWHLLSSLHIAAYTNFFRWSHIATVLPLVLASLTVVFFAFLMRPRSRLQEQR